MWNGHDGPPVTAQPEVVVSKKGVKISCATVGASIGYQIVRKGALTVAEEHIVRTWDFAYLSGVKTGIKIKAPPVWQVYDDEVINLQPGDTLKLNAMRIGFKPSAADYVNGKLYRTLQDR